MPCYEHNGFHVCSPTEYRLAPKSGECPDCQQRSWFIAVHAVWYGTDSCCLRCGRRWCDGEWMPLDFVRQSRQKSIDGFKQRYRRALNASPWLPGVH